MNLNTAIIPFIDPVSGLVNKYPNENINSIGNSVYRDVYYTMLSLAEGLYLGDCSKWINSINSSRVKDANGSPIIGLFHRSCFKPEELQAHDDYVGMMTASKHVDSGNVAREIYAHGFKNKLLGIQFWNWNNLNPFKVTPRTWFARHLPFVAHMHYCAGIEPSRMRKLMWCLGMFANSFEKQDKGTTWMLGWLYMNGITPELDLENFDKVRSILNLDFLMKATIKHWWKKFYQVNPKGMKNVMAVALRDPDSGELNTIHPLVQFGIDK